MRIICPSRFTGNYSWLNYITIALGLSAVDDRTLMSAFHLVLPRAASIPLPFEALHVIVALIFMVLSIPPFLNMLSPNQVMNYSYNPLHLVNTYGAFGSVGRERYEVVLEGTRDAVVTPATEWKDYEFKGKPGDPRRRPPLVAPYHWRLDWQVWFVAMMPYAPEWFIVLIAKLLVNDRGILKLIGQNPFPDEPPRQIRAQLYYYRFTTPEDKRETGNWWSRTLAAEFLRPVSLEKIEGKGQKGKVKS